MFETTPPRQPTKQRQAPPLTVFDFFARCVSPIDLRAHEAFAPLSESAEPVAKNNPRPTSVQNHPPVLTAPTASPDVESQKAHQTSKETKSPVVVYPVSKKRPLEVSNISTPNVLYTIDVGCKSPTTIEAAESLPPMSESKKCRLDSPKLQESKKQEDPPSENVSVIAPAEEYIELMPKDTFIISNQQKSFEVTLTHEQSMILQFVENGENVFFTGSAGTGKSVLMRAIVETLKKKHDSDAIAITAPTGIAASNIGGTTLHAFAGCGLAMEPAFKLIPKIKSNRKNFNRWRRTKVLIIDEISMVEGGFFEKLEDIARHVLDDSRPFGGIQLVICGDFLQLPPVSKKDARFVFETEAWKRGISRTILLKQVFRQSDPAFIKMLNEIRLGFVSSETEAMLAKLSRPLPPNPLGLVPTELFALRTDVDACNAKHLARIDGQTYTFTGRMAGDSLYFDKLKDCLAPDTLDLKVGAQVMLIKNKLEIGLVNGSMGRVIGFEDEGWPVVEFLNGFRLIVKTEEWTYEQPTGSKRASKFQIPLLLAYALSIHKSQGQTLPLLRVDLGKIFEKGQAYVALSRAVSLDGLQVLHFRKDKVSAHPRVTQFVQELSTL